MESAAAAKPATSAIAARRAAHRRERRAAAVAGGADEARGDTNMRRIEFSILAVAFALAAAANPATAATGAKQRTFATPEEAAQQLAAAARSGDSRALIEILGPDAKAIVASGDAVADAKSRERFARAYDEANKLERSG
ncbi:MAG: DUF2950 domain-containing protein, partial [Betaproteobacteria bacterium]